MPEVANLEDVHLQARQVGDAFLVAGIVAHARDASGALLHVSPMAMVDFEQTKLT